MTKASGEQIGQHVWQQHTQQWAAGAQQWAAGAVNGGNQYVL